MVILVCSCVIVLLRNGKGVIVYPNPLVVDLMASGIANRIALLQDHRVEPGTEILRALARLENEMDQFANAVWASIELLEGRSLGAARSPQYAVHRDTMHGDDAIVGRAARA